MDTEEILNRIKELENYTTPATRIVENIGEIREFINKQEQEISTLKQELREMAEVIVRQNIEYGLTGVFANCKECRQGTYPEPAEVGIKHKDGCITGKAQKHLQEGE